MNAGKFNQFANSSAKYDFKLHQKREETLIITDTVSIALLSLDRTHDKFDLNVN